MAKKKEIDFYFKPDEICSYHLIVDVKNETLTVEKKEKPEPSLSLMGPSRLWME